MEQYLNFIIIWIVIGVLVLPLTLYVPAPFGRHSHHRFGPQMGNRIGWLIMESPAIWFFSIVFFLNVSESLPAAWFLWGCWMVHYIHRGLIYPFRTRTSGKQIPVVIVGFAFGFQLINGYLNGVSLAQLNQYSEGWFAEPVLWIGLVMFVGGVCINLMSDNILLNLRQPNETGYKIPRGWLFSRISCPNFLGEMIQWVGWAVMCWNLAALSFAVWTIANLLPRALAHHRWYREHFEDYPDDRRAVIPGLL